MRVFIADADETWLEKLRISLVRHGHRVELTTLGADCLEKVNDFHPQLVVLEQELLPDGCEQVLRDLAANEEFRRIPVVIIGNARQGLNYVAVSQVVAWLQRPCRTSDLVDCVTRIARRDHDAHFRWRMQGVLE